jgi:serine/threonine protein kinase
MGLIYYEILYGKTPWNVSTQYELVQKSTKEPVRFPYSVPISKESKDFIKRCVQPDEAKRMSWVDVFNHAIFVKDTNNMKVDHYEGIHLDQKSMDILKELREIISKNNIDVEKIFVKFDKANNNSLDMNEFSDFVRVIDENLKPQEIKNLFTKFDINKDGNISFGEFRSLVLETDFSDV